MKFTTAFIVLAAMASAAPTDDFSAGRKLKRDLGLDRIPLTSNSAFPSVDKVIAQAAAKFGSKFAPQVPTPGGPEPGTGYQTSTISGYDIAWLTETKIGTPPQTLKLDFDTGSADLWVFSTDTPSGDAAGHVIFDESKSSTWQELDGYDWSIKYGDNSNAGGNVGLDVVNVGGVEVKKQAVETASRVSSAFARSKDHSGLLGLSFDNGNNVQPVGQKTFISNLRDVLPSGAQLFTTAFYGNRDPTKKSFWTWGYIDEGLVAASGQSLSWTNVDTSQSFWQFPVTRINVAGKDVARTADAIADTGTTLLLLDHAWVSAWYRSIPGASYEYLYGNRVWYFPNSAITKLPTFKIDVGGKLWTVQPENLIYTGRDSSTTYGAIQENEGVGINILGDSFLKSVYAVWDHGNERLGLVPKIEAHQNLTIPPQTGY